MARCYSVGVTTVRRYDSHAIPAVRKDARGFLHMSARPTRVGVLTYRRADGTEVRELRPREEVGRADSLASLQGAVMTIRHPTTMVGPDNVRDLGVGRVGAGVRLDGDYVEAPVVVERSDAIDGVESGDLHELSCGYSCKIDPTPGVWQGERYDQIQRDITYNHVALGPRGWGRAGANVSLRRDALESDDTPDACWRLDENDAVLVDEPAAGGTQTMGLRFDGISYDAPDQTVQAVNVELGKRDAIVAQAKAAADTNAARADAAEAKLAEVEAKLAEAVQRADSATAPDAVQAAVKARLELERGAGQVLGAEVKLDSLTDSEIRAQVVGKVFPAIKVEERSDDYVTALYDAALADAAKRVDSVGRARVAVEAPVTPEPVPERSSRADAHKRYLEGK